jgi:hypothetical protein
MVDCSKTCLQCPGIRHNILFYLQYKISKKKECFVYTRKWKTMNITVTILLFIQVSTVRPLSIIPLCIFSHTYHTFLLVHINNPYEQRIITLDTISSLCCFVVSVFQKVKVMLHFWNIQQY